MINHAHDVPGDHDLHALPDPEQFHDKGKFYASGYCCTFPGISYIIHTLSLAMSH
jgi:hypothetical protein